MTALNPDSAEDRRITAFTRSFPIRTREDGMITQGTISYDCWGDKQGGIFKQTVTPGYSAKITGENNHTTLELMQRGCCPPQLMDDYIEQEGKMVERDPVKEAMKLHARGYFGGGG